MKHLFRYFACAFIALSVAFPVFAENVDAVRAEQTARAFFQFDRRQGPRKASLHPVTCSLSVPTKASGEPAFYIFDRQGGGFVIVAGDDRCKPILGYSFTWNFFDGDRMPEGLKALLEDYTEQVERVRTEGHTASVSARMAWAAVEAKTKGGSGGYASARKLETPIWGQNAPFNSLAPEIDGKKAVAGCVPLAMSMICRFFTYPERGTGSLPGYTYTTDSGASQTIAGYDLGHDYQWDKIKMAYSEYTEEEAAAVAQLVYDCGVMVQAKFDSSTSSNTGNMVRQAIEHLGFDAGAVYENRGFYSDDVWTEKLKDELMDNPVLYSARREGDFGHAFLLDGFDESDHFSINWGWKGQGNGYYALSSFASSPDRAYLYKHAACFGLKPDAGGTGTNYLYLLSGTASSGTEYNGLTPLVDKIVPLQSFNMKVGGIANGGNTPFSAYFILALVDADGRIKDFVCGSQFFDTTNPRSWRGYPSISCILPVYPLPGDRIKLYYCSEDEMTGETIPWKPVVWDRTEGTVGEIPVSDDQTLAEVTSLYYGKLLGLLTIRTKDNVEWELVGSGGTSFADAVSYQGTQMTIDTSLLPKGTYTLTLRRSGDKVELKLKMGTK